MNWQRNEEGNFEPMYEDLLDENVARRNALKELARTMGAGYGYYSHPVWLEFSGDSGEELALPLPDDVF